MIRSLIAIVAAVVLGLAAARLVEGAAVLFIPGAAPTGGDWPLAYQLALLASWGLAAFVAASASLLIGRRWAPLGWLAAASMLLLAVVSALSGPAASLLLPGALIVTGAAGYGAVKVTKAKNEAPFAARRPGMF